MLIEGPSGALEAQFTPAQATPLQGIAVLCHPHPQYGGSMHDAVLGCCEETLLQQGISCLRFNFRGVGASVGTFDNGQGEVDDVLAAAAWARNEGQDQPLWLVGYSFGAAMVWQTLQRAAPARTILIAPPLGVMAFGDVADSNGEVFALAGDQDQFVDAQQFTNWRGVNSHLIAGADHFFSGAFAELQTQLAVVIKQ